MSYVVELSLTYTNVSHYYDSEILGRQNKSYKIHDVWTFRFMMVIISDHLSTEIQTNLSNFVDTFTHALSMKKLPISLTLIKTFSVERMLLYF